MTKQQRMEQLRRIGNRGAEAALRGMSLSEVAALAERAYHMSYGRLMGYVHSTGRLPPKPGEEQP